MCLNELEAEVAVSELSSNHLVELRQDRAGGSGAISAALTDEELMHRYRAGQQLAFELLYERHKGAVYRYLRRVSRDPAVAEDLCQDVWLRLVDARASYQDRAKFATWLFTIAHNCLMNHLRGRQSRLTSYECVTE